MSGAGARRGYVHIRDRWRVRAGEWVLYAMARAFRAVTAPVPLWSLTGALAPLGGWAALAVPSFRRRAETNLAFVRPDMPPRERRRLIAGAGRHFLRLMVEYARVDRFPAELEIATTGAEHLARAAARGRGAVIVTAHYGNWEAVRVAALRAGVECGLIFRAFNNRYLDAFAQRTVPFCGRPVLRKGRRGMRELKAHVAAGGVAMILVDQRTSGAPLIPFLGRPAETVTVAADLARRTGAALIPAVGRRDVAARRFEAAFEPPVDAADGAAMMAEVNARIGAWIEADPAQWFWFHRRWKATARSRPPGGAQRS